MPMTMINLASRTGKREREGGGREERRKGKAEEVSCDR
jgi:hypothetical protein